MENIMNSYIRIMDRFNKFMFWIAGILTIIMSVTILYQVFSRYILQTSLHWSEELTRYIMIWLVFIGASLALRNSQLIGVEALAEAVPERFRRWMKIAVNVVSGFFFIFLIIIGIEITLGVSVQTSPAMRIPMSWAYLSIPVGSFLMLLNSIVVLFELLLKKEGSR